MSRVIAIAFDQIEAESSAAFVQKLGLPADLAAIGFQSATDLGFEKIFAVATTGDLPPADAVAKGLAGVTSGYTHVAFVSSMRGKDISARLAGLMDAAMVTDVTAVESPSIFERFVVAGSIIAKVEVLSNPVVLTFRASNFGQPSRSGASLVESKDLVFEGSTTRTSVHSGGGARPDLTQAKVIVSGGRPLKDAATYEKLIGGLADKLGGAAGATRAAVDSGIAPNELQVGQTGKIVAPNLYIAAGVSGSTQHMAGMKDSKVIVAINTDPDAPIFEVADFGLVQDLFTAIPELESNL